MTRDVSRFPRRALAATLVALACALPAALSTAAPAGAAAATGTPRLKHVWVIELENKSFDAAFVQNSNTYLWKTLPSQGVLLRQYYGIGHFSLDNYIAELSGQAPNAVTQSDCQRYQDFQPGLAAPLGGQVVGQGCVYPASVKTLVDQLDERGQLWRGYMQDMGLDPSRDEALCGRPVQAGVPVDPSANGGLGGVDGTQAATVKDQYAARHNPFLYFHSVIDDLTSCKANVVPLEHQRTGEAKGATDLATDLRSARTTPAFSFITPNLCDDAHDAMCVGRNYGGKDSQGGLFAADQWLRHFVPLIQASPAYRDGGAIVLTLDESGDIGTPAGATACCGEPTGPNTPAPGQVGPGGGRVGTIVLSPMVKGGTVSDVPYNHYSMLRSLEDAFGIGATQSIPGSDGMGHLGNAGQAGLVPFGSDVFSRRASASPPTAVPRTTSPPANSPQAAGPGLPATGARDALPVAGLVLLGTAAVAVRRRGRA